jgi:hypothetical protein
LKCYFHAERFIGRDGELRHGELALNPDAFIGRSDADILSILANTREFFARLPPQRCPHCRKRICNERRPE